MLDALVPSILVVLALAIGWVALSRRLASSSGWSALAPIYRQRGSRRFERLTTIGLSGGHGVVHYRGCADVSADERGLRVALVLPMFRHPPLVIPWEPLRFESLEDASAVLRVEGTGVTLCLRSPHLIAQLRYWVGDGGDADDERLLPLQRPSA